ncbi:hypothetical protein HK104_000944 [Borealophlyctis nickersoniae]|nr:hypothetical protein HK104_000944 [Borealophlyctis nickersoniae]
MPRHIFVGQILSALIAFAYGYAIQSSDLVWLRTALAVGTSAGAMKIVGVSYPPGGATAYILSHLPITTWSTGQLFFYLLFPLTVGSIILVVLGVLLNNRVLGQKYPDAWI